MGHYKGYTEQDFEGLLKVLAQINGKFLLSSYPSEVLACYGKKHQWAQLRKGLAVGVSHQTTKQKVEVLTANYPIKSDLGWLPDIDLKARAVYLKRMFS